MEKPTVFLYLNNYDETNTCAYLVMKDLYFCVLLVDIFA